MQDAPVFSYPVSRQQRKSKIKSGHTFVGTRLEARMDLCRNSPRGENGFMQELARR
jgi:hypothetical protein